jgi:hypothetical protein
LTDDDSEPGVIACGVAGEDNAESMIRIERGAEVDGPKPTDGSRHGVFEYHCVRYPLVRGYSRQPLLDACRQLKSLYGLTAQHVGLFREGSEVADITCPLEVGAATTVWDHGVVKFAKYRPFDASRMNTQVAAE